MLLSNDLLLLRAAPSVLSMWPSKLTMDEEKSKNAVLVLGNWFWPSIFPQDAEVDKGIAEPNKYDLTAAPCF